ncbi:hypothetical protein [Parapedobacter sp. 2B3]|uniref:toxin-antitoxin system YwqK family antitoxin n=1 Tax=Parapedobacter sp. 2B3 TaxID=3342381 RepID=UPI0035B5EB45
MRQWLVIVFVIMVAPWSALYGSVDTTTNAPVFYERGPEDIIRFFYDDHYFLVDKHCEFKAIERVGRYDFQLQVFNGEFTDFDNQGRVALEGAYSDGRKHGDFTAYHPNGQVKWQGSFAEGSRVGSFNFFYPDGKRLLEVAYTNEGIRIVNFWDRRGRQRVTDGKGKYDFSVVADGYNEFGYIRYNRRGRVLDGYPHGSWSIEYLFDDGKGRNAGYEYYNKGRFVQGYEAYTEEEFFGAPRYGLLPLDFSNRAEAMIIKSCTIDDYTGFTGFLAEHLSAWFDGALDDMPDPTKIEFTVTVQPSGVPSGIAMKATFDNKRYADLLLEALNGLGYWLPSYAEGQYIQDTLTVTMEAFPDLRDQKIRFYDVTIRREKGI